MTPSSFSPANIDSLTDVSSLLKDDRLFYQSLIAYANSFNLDETVYSIRGLSNQFDLISSIRQQPTAVLRHDSTKLIPSYFFTKKKTDFKHLPLPIIIYEKRKDCLISQKTDIQVRRSSTPIIVREILSKPSLPNRSYSKNRLPSVSNASSQHLRPAKPPVIPNRQINREQISSNKQPRQTFNEYNQINIKVDKTISQRKEIKRVNPNEYVQRYGRSLYSKEAFHNLFTTLLL